jgi:hypothetical protein
MANIIIKNVYFDIRLPTETLGIRPSNNGRGPALLSQHDFADYFTTNPLVQYYISVTNRVDLDNYYNVYNEFYSMMNSAVILLILFIYS